MIIQGQTAADYHASEYIGSTTAKLALKSTQLFRDKITGVYSQSDKGYFQVGRLAHLMVLEPGDFARLVTSEGPINSSTNAPYGRDTQKFAKWQADNPGLTYVEPWLHTALIRCPDAIRDMFRDGASEVSAYHDLPGGLKVKCRTDYLRGNVITDLKTINDIDDCERHISKMGYWFSHAWYRMVMKAETGITHKFRLVFMEKKAPYRWRVVDLDPSYAMYGDEKVGEIVAHLESCQSKHDWADDDELFNVVSMPDYFDETIDDEDAA